MGSFQTFWLYSGYQEDKTRRINLKPHCSLEKLTLFRIAIIYYLWLLIPWTGSATCRPFSKEKHELQSYLCFRPPIHCGYLNNMGLSPIFPTFLVSISWESHMYSPLYRLLIRNKEDYISSTFPIFPLLNGWFSSSVFLFWLFNSIFPKYFILLNVIVTYQL